jgi:hypothetical protein
MTYSSGSLIQATDYNTLASNGSNIGDHWGTGTSSAGLGQSTSSIAAVSTSNTVTATQWTGLIQTINSCLAHEGQTTITPSSVTAGNAITYYASITTGSALAYTNRGTTGLALTAGATNTTSYASAWGTTGARSLVFTQTVTFSSGDAARYFFNAGGKIGLTYARSGGSATTRNTEMTALATACGTINVGYKNTTKTGGSGTVTTLLNTNNGGYWAGTGSYVVHFKQFDGVASYSTNYIQTEYFWSGTAANGGSPVLNLKSTMVNAWSNVFQDAVDGTTSVSLVVNSPATTYLSNTWGTPTFSGSVAAA